MFEPPCTVIPNGVDTEYFRRDVLGLPQSFEIVFLGRMDYFPNVDGIVHFTNEIFPLVRRQIPSAMLRIVGSSPVREVRNLARLPGVSVTGSVPDVRPYLSNAVTAIAPLRIARGTQNKVLECMAMGVPVVTTPEVAKGVQAVPGQHLLVASDSKVFASQVIDVLQKTELRNALSVAGRLQVETSHSWARSMETLDTVIDRFCRAKVDYLEKHDDKRSGVFETGNGAVFRAP